MINVLLISQIYPDELVPTFIEQSKIGLDWAAHNLNRALEEGFNANDIKPYLLNVPHVGSFPPFYKSFKVPAFSDENIDSIPFINVSYFKRKSTKKEVKKRIWNWVKKTSGEKVVIYYNFENLSLVTDIKHTFPEVKVVLMVTDLPEYERASKNIFTRINDFISPSKSKGRHFNDLDAYILLAEGMKERLTMGRKPWMLMEGIYNDEVHDKQVEKFKEKTIVYTGNLGERYGIKDLLDAFALIEDSNYRLIIRGNGGLESFVKERAAADNRILTPGRMSREDLVEMQKKATLMINPVHKSQEFTRFFFPSKTLEYMASGTPTLMSHLECLPAEYTSHLYFFDDETPEGMAKKICQVCEKPQTELDTFGKAASEFIIKNKSPKVQVKRILDFIKEI